MIVSPARVISSLKLTASKLDFVHFLEERTSTDACCKIEANQSAILSTRRLCNVPSQSHYSCSGSFSATVYGTDMEKSRVASRRHLIGTRTPDRHSGTTSGG